jgi:hypothetical protein
LSVGNFEIFSWVDQMSKEYIFHNMFLVTQYTSTDGGVTGLEQKCTKDTRDIRRTCLISVVTGKTYYSVAVVANHR